MRLFRKLPHITIILATLCLVLFILDRFNGNMRFLMNDLTKVIVALLSIFAIATSLLCIGGYLRADEAAARRAAAKKQSNRSHSEG